MTDPKVRALGLAVEFGGRRVLDGVSLEAATSSLTAIIGANGAGKTTLLRALGGLLPETTGVLLLDGEDPRRCNPVVLANLRAYAPQDPASAWDFEIGELRGLSTHPEAFGEWLRRLELDDLAERRLSQLSVGQRKAAFLALTLSALGDPFGKILLLDEPAAGLDRRRQELVRGLVRGIARAGATVIAATHDLDFAAGCDQLVLLSEGRVIAHGPPSGILGTDLMREALGGDGA